MRVIAGTARGRRLFAPRGVRIRPTADRVKEAIFSIILARGWTPAGKRVLDLCAGTGSLGIEALSRGAGDAVFVDNHRESVALINRNLMHAGFAAKGRVIQSDAQTALKSLTAQGGRFDLVLLDPPYRTGLAEKLLTALSVSPVLNTGALVVAEVDAGKTLPLDFGPLQGTGRRVYGDTAILILERAAGEPPCREA